MNMQQPTTSPFLRHVRQLNAILGTHDIPVGLNDETGRRLVASHTYLAAELFGYSKLLELAARGQTEGQTVYRKAA